MRTREIVDEGKRRNGWGQGKIEMRAIEDVDEDKKRLE